MSEIRAFRGLRPRPEVVERVAAPPYDVLSSEEARQLAAGNPLSWLHVSKPEIDFPPGVDSHADEVYRRGAENLQRLTADATLKRDETPCYYVYRLRMGQHIQHGLVLGASVEEYERDLIKKHELTRRDKEDDRARHTEILRANAGPVLLTYRARPAIDELIAGIVGQQRPVYDFTSADGIGHTLWTIAVPDTLERLTSLFAQVPALYIADGHHRSASAFRLRNNLRERNSHHTGREGYNHFLAVAFPDTELRILGYHRAVADLNGLSFAAFLERVDAVFDRGPTDRPEPEAPRSFGMLLEEHWYRLTARPGTFPPDDPVRSLDVSILQDNLLAPVLGIGDPRTDRRIDFIGGIRGPGELERRCRTDMRVAFALHPVGVDQLMAIADSGAIMPPKSTWFEPKLRSGVVVRLIDE